METGGGITVQSDFDYFTNVYIFYESLGGTVDITLHEIQKDGKIKELEQASGGAWGGTYVDQAFYDILEDLLGKQHFERYQRDHAADLMEIYSEFEHKKRGLESVTDKTTCARNISLTIPLSLKHFYKSTFDKDIEHSSGEGFVWCQDKLRISCQRFSDLFDVACTGIVNHIEKLLNLPRAEGTNTILMVGGFSESLYLQNKIKDSFKHIKIVVPIQAGLAVLKGAVLFGHDPSAISVRVARYTYGVNTCVKFDRRCHPQSKQVKIDDSWYCKGVFSKHVQKGDVIEIDKATEDHPYVPIHRDQKSISFKIFTSSEDDPKYTDDESCKYLGSLEVDISGLQRESEKSVRLKFIFGGTEFKVVGKIEDTDKEVDVKFQFLEDNPRVFDEENVCIDD